MKLLDLNEMILYAKLKKSNTVTVIFKQNDRWKKSMSPFVKIVTHILLRRSQFSGMKSRSCLIIDTSQNN